MASDQAEGRRKKLPLEGFRVLDLGTMIAAPYCATILGEFGAEVIKIEKPGSGDPWRRFGEITAAGASMNWLNESRNKKSITLDLTTPQGIEILKELVRHCDVLVENFRPGTLEKWGIGPDALKSIKRDLILARISAYGQDGPYRNRPGYARVAHGFAGLSYLAGEPDGPPVVPGSTSLADYISGLYAALGTLIALIARERFGTGEVIDVALYEGVLRMLDEIAPVYAKTGEVRQRMGADTVNAVPHSHYETSDGRWVALACSSDKMFERLAMTMNRPDLLAPDRYASVSQRVAHRDEVNRIVADWIRTMPLDGLMKLCLENEVPIGPINSIADILADEHVQARKNFVEMKHSKEGSVLVPNVIPRLSEMPGEIRSLGPDLGEHNEEVYRDLLGLSAEAVGELRDKKII